MHFDDMKRLVARAMASGAKRQTSTLFTWDVSGNCEKPVYRELHCRPSVRGQRNILVAPGKSHPLTLEMTLRCKKCPKCLQLRTTLWRQRAVREFGLATRTWFGTLTIAPEWRHKYLSQARQREADQGIDFDALKSSEQFRCIHRQIGIDLTKWLKRVRKESGAPLRYLLVAEAHKSGHPHYHVLIYEQDVAYPVRKSILADQWKLGFTRWKLVEDPRAATYLCKYLSKDARARVRASVEFGLDALERSEAVSKRDPPNNFGGKLDLKRTHGSILTDLIGWAAPQSAEGGLSKPDEAADVKGENSHERQGVSEDNLCGPHGICPAHPGRQCRIGCDPGLLCEYWRRTIKFVDEVAREFGSKQLGIWARIVGKDGRVDRYVLRQEHWIVGAQKSLGIEAVLSQRAEISARVEPPKSVSGYTYFSHPESIRRSTET